MLLNLQGWKSKMATTSIWAVKDNLDRVLNYASNPLKTKETDSGYEYEGLENVIDYAVNDDKMILPAIIGYDKCTIIL